MKCLRCGHEVPEFVFVPPADESMQALYEQLDGGHYVMVETEPLTVHLDGHRPKDFERNIVRVIATAACRPMLCRDLVSKDRRVLTEPELARHLEGHLLADLPHGDDGIRDPRVPSNDAIDRAHEAVMADADVLRGESVPAWRLRNLYPDPLADQAVTGTVPPPDTSWVQMIRIKDWPKDERANERRAVWRRMFKRPAVCPSCRASSVEATLEDGQCPECGSRFRRGPLGQMIHEAEERA